MDNIPEHFRHRIQEAKEKQLEGLDLSNNRNADDKDKLTEIPPEVFELYHLKVLKLDYNRISYLPESLVNLTRLTHLDLGINQLSELPYFIGKLANLTYLNLGGNYLSKLPKSLSKLNNLNYLYLSGIQIQYLPDSIGELTNLSHLNLGGNYLSKLPKSLSKLNKLTHLILWHNKLSDLPEYLCKLTNLTELYLGANQLSKLPESFGNLTSLTVLALWDNQLSKLPKSFGNLTKLTDLGLNRNQLSELPETFGNLTSLTSLAVDGNQISELPESLANLTNLTNLYLDNNQILELSEFLCNLPNLNYLGLSGNPLVKPPIEIANQGIEAIRDYFQQIKAEGSVELNEAKLLILGEAGAGKTSLAKKIISKDYQLQEEDSTQGIDVLTWHFPTVKGQNFWVNIWDFGGQEIYHATHQFFLTKRSLYALVADNRREDTDFYYWLNVVELLSDNSPLLIIKNEKQDRQKDINETALRGQFTNLEKTLATNLANNRGLEEILTDIKHYIQKLPHIGQVLPKTWEKVRQVLEQDSRNHITLQEYFNICNNNQITRRENKFQLSKYLHDLGVCLHFQDEEDSLLYKTVILKPEWGTDAVYKVLDNKQVINNQGEFTRNDLKNIWCEDKYFSMRGELLELMKKFQLCYEIPSNKNTFIAPQLLKNNQPK